MCRQSYSHLNVGTLLVIFVLEIRLACLANANEIFSSTPSVSTGATRPMSTGATYAPLSRTDDSQDSTFEVHLWDKSKMSPVQYQMSFCSKRCNDTRTVYTERRYICQTWECFPCTCEKPLCEFYGACCMDVQEEEAQEATTNLSDIASESYDYQYLTEDFDTDLNQGGQHSSLNGMEADLVCVDESMDFHDSPGRGTSSYLIVKSCPASWTDQDLRAKCEDEIPTNERTRDDLLHVSDNATGLTFFNKYCALCNGFEEYIQWNLTIKCRYYGKVYTAVNRDEFLRLASDPYSECEVSQHPPESVTTYRGCPKDWFETSLVDTCNVTGSWRYYDKDVESACEERPGSLRDRVRDSEDFQGLIYKNIFCAVCNMPDYPKTSLQCTLSTAFGGFNIDFRKSNIDVLPLSLIINFDSQESNSASKPGHVWSKCSSSSEWYSPENKCIPMQCSPGKVLVNGSCTTALEEIRGLAYQLRLLYIPSISKETSLSEDYLPHITSEDENEYLLNFVQEIQNIFRMSTTQLDIDINLYTDSATSSQSVSEKKRSKRRNADKFVENIHYLRWFELTGKIEANMSYSRDDVEKMVVNNLFASVTISNSKNKSVILKPLLISKEREQNMFKCSTIRDRRAPCQSARILPVGPSTLNLWYDQDIPIMTPELVCPHVVFKDYIIEVSYSTIVGPTWSLKLNFGVIELHFTEPDELNRMSVTEDETLTVCVELLESKIGSFVIYNAVRRWQYVLTMICLSASLFCLVLTLLTYLLFKQLRSVAGIYNICLCTSLLLAQTFLIASSHVRETGPACTFLAIATHFLWLTMFCWCFACCFNMFRVFTAKTRSARASPNSQILYFVKRIILCSSLPALVVIVVIVVNVVTTEGRQIGYGAMACFLDSSLLITTAMVTPLAVILLFNFIFFIVTIVKIHKVNKLQAQIDTQKTDRDNLYIYIKLSSMTGAFWIIQIISEALDNDVLRFMAIFLNGLQGVFIFLSYICNKRVFKLYVRAMGVEDYLPVSVTTDRSTLGRLASEVNKAGRETGSVESANKKTLPISPGGTDTTAATMESCS